MNTPRSNSRRGAGGIAVVVMLVFVQLLIVGAIVTGTRDLDMTPIRLDTTRAFYATEAGMNMAIRESIRGIDEDLDGTIGTISSDGNANNDPLLVNARFSVDRSVSGGATSLVSSGRAGIARRRANSLVGGVIGGVTQTVMTGFGRNNSSQPRFSAWNGSSWSASQALTAISAEPKWVRMKICPTRNETCMIIETENDQVHVYFYNGTSWSTPYLLSTDTGGTNDRPEDLGYEQVSSNAVCVYWKGTTSTFGYRRYNGTTFLAEQTLSSPFTTEADFVTLFPRPASNEILLVSADGIAGGKLCASLWNGTSWGAWTTLITNLTTNNQECYSTAFESNTGRGVTVYSEIGQSVPRYRTLTGSSWSAQASLPTIGGVAHWIRLAADPTSNKILFVALDDQGDLNANVWSGSAWGTNIEHDSNIPDTDRRQFDVLFERGTGRALLVYVENGLNYFRYRTWNGSAWSAEMSGPNLGATPEIIHLARGIGNGEIFIACSDASMRLHLIRWDGSAMGTDNIIENTLSGQVQYYSFAVPEPTVAPHPRVESWAEVTP